MNVEETESELLFFVIFYLKKNLKYSTLVANLHLNPELRPRTPVSERQALTSATYPTSIPMQIIKYFPHNL